MIVDISSILLHFRIYHKTLILKKISTLSFLRSKDCSSLLISGRQRILHSAAQVQSSVHKYSLTSYYVSGIKQTQFLIFKVQRQYISGMFYGEKKMVWGP